MGPLAQCKMGCANVGFVPLGHRATWCRRVIGAGWLQSYGNIHEFYHNTTLHDNLLPPQSDTKFRKHCSVVPLSWDTQCNSMHEHNGVSTDSWIEILGKKYNALQFTSHHDNSDPFSRNIGKISNLCFRFDHQHQCCGRGGCKGYQS